MNVHYKKFLKNFVYLKVIVSLMTFSRPSGSTFGLWQWASLVGWLLKRHQLESTRWCVVVHGMPGVFVCACVTVLEVVDAASCVPRGLQTQSEPLLWPDLCKSFPLWNCLCLSSGLWGFIVPGDLGSDYPSASWSTTFCFQVQSVWFPSLFVVSEGCPGTRVPIVPKSQITSVWAPVFQCLFMRLPFQGLLWLQALRI